MLVYEYAVIRFVPKVEREEFINIGVILFCKSKRYIKAEFHLKEELIKCFCSEVDYEQLVCHVNAFFQIAKGTAKDSPIAQMDVAERFRWLTAVKSSCIQASRPHPGMTLDLEILFNNLFEELVL
ncbi:MAG: DUF3037 domain-containing protein [Flavobacteriaceae bacterium]|jgi:hypothetical protein|nr:DUF3037 domain-containing protein [Flavobacteriaceae bacterium]